MSNYIFFFRFLCRNLRYIVHYDFSNFFFRFIFRCQIFFLKWSRKDYSLSLKLSGKHDRYSEGSIFSFYCKTCLWSFHSIQTMRSVDNSFRLKFFFLRRRMFVFDDIFILSLPNPCFWQFLGHQISTSINLQRANIYLYIYI